MPKASKEENNNMHESLHISAYTPSNTDPEILEKMFVQREKLLERSVAWCEESLTTDKKNHLLFVGPRGSGKTHFISMVVNRLKAKAEKDKELQEKMIIVWLGEDDVINQFIDLPLAIIEALVRSNPKAFNKNCLKVAQGEKPDSAAEIILESITQQVAGRTILLLKENMSDVFSGLKKTGQMKLRAYLQEHNNMAILATSQQLFEGVSSRDAAFWGFFDLYHLETLGVEDAKQLISNIAALKGDQELVDYLATAQGTYRVRALHHLAGGNHRLYVELAAFLTMESLDDFVSALSKLADDLTPYFQERIRSLPNQQAKIIQKLCELQGATPVKEIAEATFIGERSVAKQLGDLAKIGYVIRHKRGKQSYYEMAEPLMRLSLEVKNNHGKPLRMVASLLRIWFTDSELAVAGSDHVLAAYQEAAMNVGDDIFNEINQKAMSQLYVEIKENNDQGVVSVSSEILTSQQGRLTFDNRLFLFYIRGAGFSRMGMYDECIRDCNEVISLERSSTKKLDNDDKEKITGAFLLRGLCYYRKGEIKLALSNLIEHTQRDLFTAFSSYQIKLMLLISELHFSLSEIDKGKGAIKEVLSLHFTKNDKNLLGLINVISSIVKLGFSIWEELIAWLLLLFQKHDMQIVLSMAVIGSISAFTKNKELLLLLPKWQSLWQKHAEQYPEMEIALQALKAASDAIEQQNDKPLLALPKEIRELVMPLVEKALPSV